MTIFSSMTLEQVMADRKTWGHILESAVGAYIVNEAFKYRFEVTYWRDRNDEVDFVLKKNNSLVAIEVKGNAEKQTSGLNEFRKKFNPKNAFIVGPEGIRPEEFLKMDLRKLF